MEDEDVPAVSFESAIEMWEAGHWHELCGLSAPKTFTEFQRSRFALVKAAALLQLGRCEDALEEVALARRLDCDKGTIASILIAGVYNTLGRVAALGKHEEQAGALFEEAIRLARVPGRRDVSFVAHRRSVSQMADMGLLRQASILIESQLESIVEGSPAARFTVSEKIEVLSSEIRTLAHELSLAYSKNQLFHSAPAPEDGLGTLRSRSPSQLGQDLWVLEQSGFKRGGFFVEFGATDGILLSNTYLLETEFGWTGICADPNPEYFELLKVNRTCTVDDACISARTGEKVEFILAQEYGGIASFSESDQHAGRRMAYRRAGRTVQLTTISLNDFLVRHDAPRDIDYISIDTEGSEYEILRTFPLEDWNVRCFTVEHNNSTHRDSIHELLAKHGYTRTAAQWEDWYSR